MKLCSIGQDIDLEFRPSNYFWARDLGIPLSTDIKGQERRSMLMAAMQAGQEHLLDTVLRQATLDEPDRRSLGSIHPAFMGGEYLPDTKKGEVEIARIAIASTTQDVTAVYARRVGQRIHYRVVDEYEGSTLSDKSTRTSARPLTLNQLVEFFFEAWDLLDVLSGNFIESGNGIAEDARGFVTGAESGFYPQFEELVESKVEAWIESKSRPVDEEDVDDDDV
jgi:hypothetical protein